MAKGLPGGLLAAGYWQAPGFHPPLTNPDKIVIFRLIVFNLKKIDKFICSL